MPPLQTMQQLVMDHYIHDTIQTSCNAKEKLRNTLTNTMRNNKTIHTNKQHSMEIGLEAEHINKQSNRGNHILGAGKTSI